MLRQWKQLLELDPRAARVGLFVAIIYLLFTILPIPAASPFFKFGMYSAPQHMPEKFEVIKLYVNGDLQTPKQYSMRHWDAIIGPLYQYYREMNPQYHPLLYKRKVLEKLHLDINSVADTNIRNRVELEQFMRWNARQIRLLRGGKVDSIRVAVQTYRWQNGMYPSGPEIKLLYYENHSGNP